MIPDGSLATSGVIETGGTPPGTGSTPPQQGNTGLVTEGIVNDPPNNETPKSDPAWIAQLKNDVKADKATVERLSKYENLTDFAKAYLEVEGKLNKSITMPEKPEDWQDFYAKIGKPKDADGYSFSKQEGGKEIALMAFKANLTESQAKELYNSMANDGMKNLSAMRQAQAEELKATEAALKLEYGDKFAEKNAFLSAGLKAAGDSAVKAIVSSGIAGNLGITKMLIALGEVTSEKAALKGGGSDGGNIKTLAGGGGFDYSS